MKCVAIVKRHEKFDHSIFVCGDRHSVDRQESVRDCEGDALVAVHEWVVLRKAFPESCRLGDDVSVITRLRPEESSF